MRSVHLAEVAALAQQQRQTLCDFAEFRHCDLVARLQWPDDVLEQWLYDHADNEAFLSDYGSIDLSGIRWDVEILSVETLICVPTGPSDAGCLEEYAANPDHWIDQRRFGVHMGVAECWEAHGTWKRWPILIDRELLQPRAPGLQVVEGRTRLGILRGRHGKGHHVAPRHLAWVGRPKP